MFNGKLKEEALNNLKSAQQSYDSHAEQTQEMAVELHEVRRSSADETIPAVEAYINSLANSPKEFDRSFAEYKAEFKAFNHVIQELEVKAREAQIQSGSTVGAGVAAGVGVAAFAPTAAMAVATTFGTASTGTAIASLSGAAATKAALAWLGGGALTAGGGGMVAGKALLAMAGPVGWAIGGAAVVGGGVMARSKNKKIAEEANDERRKLEVHIRNLETAKKEVRSLIDLTRKHSKGVMELLLKLKYSAPNDYLAFNAEQKNEMAALVNNIRCLSPLLNKKIA